MAGDCFAAAIRVATDLASRGAEPVIAHGTPIGRGPENAGRRYWHAWVEVHAPGIGWVVLDHSSGQQVNAKRVAYYRAGRIDHDEHVWRFPPAEARAAALRFAHSGPWVDNADAMPVL